MTSSSSALGGVAGSGVAPVASSSVICSLLYAAGFSRLRTGADRRRGGRVRTQPHEHPGRRRAARQLRRARLRHPGDGQAMCHGPRHRSIRIGMPLENRNRAGGEDRPPVPPARQLGQVVGAHQPDEPVPGPCGQPAQRVGGVAGAEPRLQRQHPQARVTGDRRRPGHALGQRRHAGLGLERVLRRDQPPDLVQLQPLQRLQADVAVAGVRRIERAAEQAHPELAARRAQARPAAAGRVGPPAGAAILGSHSAVMVGRLSPAASGRCRAPGTCSWSAARRRPARARAAGRSRCRSPHPCRTRRRRRTACWRCG